MSKNRPKGVVVITTPGKFEGEPIYLPLLYDQYLNGFFEEAPDDTFTVDIIPEHVELFPELRGFTSATLYEDPNGFVTLVELLPPH